MTGVIGIIGMKDATTGIMIVMTTIEGGNVLK